MLALLKNRAYLNLWLAQIISMLGDGITKILIVFLAAQLSDNPIVISFVVLAQIIPSTILGTFAGPFVDRFSKKRIMFSSDIYRAIIVLLMIPSQNSLVLMLILVFLEGIGSVFFDPARASIIPRIVGEENIAQSISLSQATSTTMRMIGPAIGGILITLQNFSLNFMITTATFLISAVFIMLIPNVQTQSKTANKSAKLPFKQSYKEGFQIVFGNQGLFAVILLLIPTMLAVGVINANMSAAFLYTFKVVPPHFGFLETAFGIGSLCGAIAASRLIKRFMPHHLILGAIISIGVICILILLLVPLHNMFGVWPIYVWILLLGIAVALISVPLGSLFVAQTPDQARGRAMAIFNSLSSTMTIIGIVSGGWFASSIDILWSISTAGILLVVVTLIFPMLKYYRALKNMEQGIKPKQQQAAPSA